LTRGCAANSIPTVGAHMKKVISALLAFSMLFFYVPMLGAAETVKISPKNVTCIPVEAQALLLCDVMPSTPIAWVRVYFNSNAYKDDYFVEMRRGAGNRFFGVLPFVDRTITKGVTYRMVVKSPEGIEFSTERANVPVSGNCPVLLSDDEKKNASNLVVGATKSGQPLAPPDGFLCKNIVSVITFNGEMKPAEECRKLLAAGAAGGGIPTGVYLAAGAAMGIGGGFIIANNTGGGGNPPVSSARPAAPNRR
jgi:hypothetical protein